MQLFVKNLIVERFTLFQVQIILNLSIPYICNPYTMCMCLILL